MRFRDRAASVFLLVVLVHICETPAWGKAGSADIQVGACGRTVLSSENIGVGDNAIYEEPPSSTHKHGVIGWGEVLRHHLFEFNSRQQNRAMHSSGQPLLISTEASNIVLRGDVTQLMILRYEHRIEAIANVRSGGLARILENDSNTHRRSWGEIGQSIGGGSHPSSLAYLEVSNSSIGGSTRLAQLPGAATGLPSGQARIDDDESEPYHLHSKPELVSGFLLFIGGLALLYEVWCKFAFYLAANMNAATHVALVMGCAVVMWSGMLLAASGLGVFTHV